MAGDVALSTSLLIADDLIAGSRDSGLTDTELAATLLVLNTVLSATPRLVHASISFFHGPRARASPNGLLDFVIHFVDLANRVLSAVMIQVVNLSVRTHVAWRSVRILSLVHDCPRTCPKPKNTTYSPLRPPSDDRFVLRHFHVAQQSVRDTRREAGVAYKISEKWNQT